MLPLDGLDNLVDNPLKRPRGILQTERNSRQYEDYVMRLELRLVLFGLVDLNLPVHLV